MIVVAILALSALSALLAGVLFSGVWNLFVVAHVAGATHASFGACILAGLVLVALLGSSAAGGSK